MQAFIHLFGCVCCRVQVRGYIHRLMRDADNVDATIAYQVENHMHPFGKAVIIRRNVRTDTAPLRIISQPAEACV